MIKFALKIYINPPHIGNPYPQNYPEEVMAAVSGDSVQPPAVTPEDSADKLTADEAEQYDRQIRLWGLEAQKRSFPHSLC